MSSEDSIQIIEIEDRTIAIKGIGRMFYEEGFPISMAIEELSKKGIEVSLLHIADECLKNGIPPKTVINKIKQDIDEDINKDSNKTSVTFEQLSEFCEADYDRQREMLFNYLFGSRETAADWLRENLYNYASLVPEDHPDFDHDDYLRNVF